MFFIWFALLLKIPPFEYRLFGNKRSDQIIVSLLNFQLFSQFPSCLLSINELFAGNLCINMKNLK